MYKEIYYHTNNQEIIIKEIKELPKNYIPYLTCLAICPNHSYLHNSCEPFRCFLDQLILIVIIIKCFLVSLSLKLGIKCIFKFEIFSLCF